MGLSEEDMIKLTTMITDVLDLENMSYVHKAKESPLFKNILVLREFLNIDNPYSFTFNNEHDNDLFKAFLLACLVDYMIHKLSLPEVKFNLSDPEETNYEKIFNIDLDVEQIIVLILLRIKNGQHFKCLSLGEKYYSINEADNNTVCTGVLKDIFNSILIQEELLYSTLSSLKEYRSYTVSQQFRSICKVIDKCGIWDDNRLTVLIKNASEDRHSPAGYLFTKLYTKFLSIYMQYPSPTVHKIVILFEFYNNTDMVEFDEQKNIYIYTKKFIDTAKDIVQNVHAHNISTAKDKSKMQEIETNILNFSQDKTSIVQ